MKRVAFVVVLLLGFAEFTFFVPVSLSQSEALQVYTGTGCISYKTKGFGLDLPQISYCLSPSKFSFADTRANMTLNIPTLSGVALTLTTSKNSTALNAHLAGTVLAHAVSIDILWVQQKFNALVTIQGTITGLSGTLPLAFPLVGTVSWAGGTFANIGPMAFDWSADAASASFSNSTKTLTFNLGATFNIDPLALDNTVNTSCASAASCTTAGAIEGLNDVLILFCGESTTADGLSASSNPALTWTKRKSISQTGQTEDEFYAISSASQSYTFTCNMSPNAASSVRAFGISGADPTPTFDPNGAVPCTATGTGVPNPTESCTLSTSNPNDFIYGGFYESIANAITVGSGFTIIGNNARIHAEYQIVTSTQTNLAVTATFTGTPTWNLIGDAVEANNCCTSTTSTTTSTTTTVTNNLGEAPNFLWLLALVFIPLFFVLLKKKF